MVEEARQLSPEELHVYEALKDTATVKEINSLMSEKGVDYKLVDDYLFREKTSKTLVGLTIQKASGGWPRNREEVLQLLKIQVDKKADFPRTLAVESKSQAPRDHLKILLEIIFSESIVALEPEPDAGNINNLDLEEIAANAAENTRFLWAIDGLYHYYCHKKNQNSVPATPTSQYKTLEIKRKELQLHKIEADPYFRSLKWLLETGILHKGDKDGPNPKSSYQYQYIPGIEELNLPADDIILGTLQLVSDIRGEIPATDSYLKREYQQLSDQAEEFAVALIDEVQDEKDLSAVIMMEDKFSGSGKDAFKDSLTWTREGNISLIQHAINLRCKSVSIHSWTWLGGLTLLPLSPFQTFWKFTKKHISPFFTERRGEFNIEPCL